MVDGPSPGVLVQGSNTMGLTIKDYFRVFRLGKKAASSNKHHNPWIC